MTNLAFCTVIRKSQLAEARVLASSLRRHHPGSPLYVLLTDPDPGLFEPALEPWRSVSCEELALEDLASLRFRSTAHELACALKPFFFSWLFRRHSVNKLVYLDAGTLVLARFSSIARWLENSSILLVPNLVNPLPDDGRLPDEITFLEQGAYNLGFLALRRGPVAAGFLRWWGERLRRSCVEEQETNVYLDQKWCDLVPCYYDEAGIVRHQGYAAGTWVRGYRDLRVSGPDVWSGRALRRFIQFRPPALDAVPRLRPLLQLYRGLLREHGHARTSRWSYSFDTFDNGVRIPPLARSLYAALGPASRRFGDPFATRPRGSFYRWLNGPPMAAAGGITRFWAEVLRTHPKAQERFPEPCGRDRARFLAWAASRGIAETGADPALCPWRQERPAR